MLSQASSTSEIPSGEGQEVATTATFNGQQFHLHQVVGSVPVNGDGAQREWIIVGLDDGLKLASPDFEQETQYPSEKIPSSIEPQVAGTGEPIFGY